MAARSKAYGRVSSKADDVIGNPVCVVSTQGHALRGLVGVAATRMGLLAASFASMPTSLTAPDYGVTRPSRSSGRVSVWL
jgi:hypothetical protein